MLDLKLKENCLDNMSDEELVKLSSSDRRAVSVLISRYSEKIWTKAYLMSNSPADADDFAQEGLLGFLNAISKYNPQRNAKFSTFAEICVINKMKTILNRNSDNAVPTDEFQINEDTAVSDTPETIFMRKEHLVELYDEINSILSKREWDIFSLFLKGCSYRQIADELEISTKSVDNAIQRIRKKLKTAWIHESFTEP
jgi:RNA polymerase sporulation-specific sigma factor